MAHIHDSAVVLKRLDFSESSQVVVAYTRDHGKVHMIAKGARRSTRTRFSPGIDLLEEGAVVLSVRRPAQEQLAIVTEWKQVRLFSGLRESLPRLNAAQYAADILAGLTEVWDPHPPLYDGFIRTLAALTDADRVLVDVLEFQRLLLEQCGLLPRLDVCVACGRLPDASQDIYFSSFEGGLLCRDCEGARVEKRLVTVPLDVLRNAKAPTDADVAASFDLFNYHLSHLTGRSPAAAEYLLTSAKGTQRSAPNDNAT